MERKPYKRSFKNLIINPFYQMKYIFWVGSTGLTIVLGYTLIFYSYMKENYAILVDLSPMSDDAKSQLYRELHQVLIILSSCSVAFIGMVSFFGLVFSHRTAGPLYHFKRVFREIESGNRKARVKLRPKDDFQDVASAFNHMMDVISAREVDLTDREKPQA